MEHGSISEGRRKYLLKVFTLVTKGMRENVGGGGGGGGGEEKKSLKDRIIT